MIKVNNKSLTSSDLADAFSITAMDTWASHSSSLSSPWSVVVALPYANLWL